MEPARHLELRSLREQVYEHLRSRINRGDLRPGSFLDLNALGRHLGISRTPLRDALIQLETEGFVSILPRRGVVVRTLTLDDVRHLYEILGALEGVALLSVSERLGPEQLAQMQSLNESMREAVQQRDFDRYYDLNLDFHGVFLKLSDNHELRRIVEAAKQRLYDFPRREGFLPDWELESTREHAELLARLEKGETRRAADFLRDVHWSFAVQEPFIRRYYGQEGD